MPIMSIYRLNEIPPDKLNQIMNRSELEIDQVIDNARTVLENVKTRGDEALKEYSQRFDGVKLDSLKVSEEEYKEADRDLEKDVKNAIEHAAKNISSFHRAQLPAEKWFKEVEKGITVGQIHVPLHTIGLYVPGGKGFFPSTVLMGALPAKIAGVEKIIICTPPKQDGKVDAASLYAAKLVGVKEVYKVGGAQAIAAMAYGTETIPKVDKIVGPGGVWVASAKRLVQLHTNVAIEFTAGPSENLIVADETANPEYVAADALIESEHGSDSAGLVVTTSRELAEKVQLLVDKYAQELPNDPIPRRRFAKEALKKYGAIIVTKNIQEAIDFVNKYSPEHLQIMTKDPLKVLKRVRNAGSIYLGNYSPTSVGCYACGVNHIIPTGRGAAIYSTLSVTDFLKQHDVSQLSKEGLSAIRKTVSRLARYEGFPQHEKAVELRFK